MWLRDEVAKTTEKARVLLYGYDTSLVNSESFQDVSDIAQRLTSDLNAMRSGRSVSISCPRDNLQTYSFPTQETFGTERNCLCSA